MAGESTWERAPSGPGTPYAVHFFVCTQGPECPHDGPAEAICATLKRQVKEKGLRDQVRVNRSGCLGQCGHGPMMVVYPEAAWYSHLDVNEATAVFDAHIADAQPRVAHLRYRLGPGGMKAQKDEGGRSACDHGCRNTKRP